MSIYIRNRYCPCHRCRARGLTGPVVLITLGALFLMENFQVLDSEKTWPVILIVIGLSIFARRNASTEGHIQPFAQAPAIQQDNSQVNP
ncbi:MAG TPA: DUF5668 domain-containing protein [Candidatus Saccharimonadales bacterium]|jgi:hypothetical protein|nr:DUF5668 domain-containing protein [Candidatus Saccharimonadales bacterium]